MADTGTILSTDVGSIIGRPYNVVLFNDSEHSMDEVAGQIIKAIHCDEGTAIAKMMEAHSTGRSIVFSGGLERCEHVESILSEIRLGTKIEQA